MAAHRYWRILITASRSSSYVSIAKMELMDVNRIDQCGSGTASASSYYAPESLTPAMAFDSDVFTKWASNAGMPGSEWLMYDFGAGNAKDIVYFKIAARADGFGDQQGPKDFSFQYSDDSTTWTTVVSITGAANWGVFHGARYYTSAGLVDPPPPSPPTTTGQVWRIKATAVNGGPIFAVNDVKMRVTPGGADQCSGGTAVTSHISEGTAASAFDGALSYWSGGSVLTDWIGYAFSSVKAIVEVTIQARQTNAAQAPQDFTIDYWDVNHWTTAHTVTGSTAWASLETRTFTFGTGPSSARPVVCVCC